MRHANQVFILNLVGTLECHVPNFILSEPRAASQRPSHTDTIVCEYLAQKAHMFMSAFNPDTSNCLLRTLYRNFSMRL